MNKSLLTAVLAASLSLLGGCAMFCPGKPDPAAPQVSIKGGRIVVSPEPLVFLPTEKDVLIVWQLPRGAAFRFPDNGIVVDGAEGEIVDCKPRKERLEFTCLNRHTKRGTYKYTIRVREGDNSLDALDPTVMNM